MDRPPSPPAAALPAPDPVFLKVALPFVIGWEGMETRAYLDTIARPPVWTVCVGETKGVKPGDTYTEAQCRAMLQPRLLEFRRAFHAATRQEVLDALPVGRDVAFTSLGYNIGQSALRGSTALRRLNADDPLGACEALTWWDKAGGRVVFGLTRRRASEHALCIEGAA